MYILCKLINLNKKATQVFRYEIEDLTAKKKRRDNVICQEREMRGEKRERKEWVTGDILRLFLTYPILLERSR
jgi:hypothetical protein